MQQAGEGGVAIVSFVGENQRRGILQTPPKFPPSPITIAVAVLV